MATSADLNDPASAEGSTAAPNAPGPSGPALAEPEGGRLQRLAKRNLWMHFTRMGSYEDADIPVGIVSGIAGIELMQEIGIEDTRKHVLALNARLLEGLDELRATVVTPRRPKRRGALICVKSLDASELVAALGREGVVTSERDGNLRISAHAYNSTEDMDELLAALARHKKLLA